MKRLIPFLLLAVAAAAGVYYWRLPKEDPTRIRLSGNLEITEINAAFKTPGRVVELLVKEGDTVKKGQKIAEMGSTDAESPRLHFEIRRQGKPADPQKFLPAR